MLTEADFRTTETVRYNRNFQIFILLRLYEDKDLLYHAFAEIPTNEFSITDSTFTQINAGHAETSD